MRNPIQNTDGVQTSCSPLCTLERDMYRRRIARWIALLLLSEVTARTSAAAQVLPAALPKMPDMLGRTIEGRDGKDIGRLQGVVFEADTGNVTLTMLTSGGLAGLGEKPLTIPWYVLQQPISTDNIRLTCPPSSAKALRALMKSSGWTRPKRTPGEFHACVPLRFPGGRVQIVIPRRRLERFGSAARPNSGSGRVCRDPGLSK
jgi:hypothetical protein